MDEQPKNNNSQSQGRILKNAGYLTAAFIIQKILSFLYFVYIARVIGPVDLGFYDPAYGDFARDLGSVPGKLEDHGFKRVSPPMNGNSSGGGFS